jgi:hypothetical protein
MKIKDRVYGIHEITSPVIVELLDCPSVQRLRNIGQLGIPKEFETRSFKFSRYDHSVGVMLLLKMLGADEEEQIAGLLHDVSHTAFSHTIDILFRRKTEDFQDSQHERFITTSEIPSILKKHGYTPSRIYNYQNFSLLEQKLPLLCADRVDYSLRESPKATIYTCLPHVTTAKGRIVFDEASSARAFADRFIVLQSQSWGGKIHNIRAQLLAQGLHYALEQKILSMDDLWTDDTTVLHKLHQSHDDFIKKVFKLLKKKSYDDLPTGGSIIKKKFRYVDPEILVNGSLIPLSQIDLGYRSVLDIAKKKNEEGIVVPLLTP